MDEASQETLSAAITPTQPDQTPRVRFPWTLITKPQRGAVPLEEFPGLIAKVGHTGGCGVLFFGIWLIGIYHYFPSVYTGPFILHSIIVMTLFILLLWLTVRPASNYATAILETANDPEGMATRAALETSARAWVLLLSAANVLTCAWLIWLTGGVASPFTAFYVMVFTLTIAKCKVPFPGFLVLVYFSVIIAAACLAAYRISLIDDTIMTAIQKSDFQLAMLFGFLLASLAVPTVSAWFVTIGEQRRLKRGRNS